MADILIGHRDDFAERRARVVHYQGVEWAVFRLSDGTYRAVENSCPHKQGKLSEGMVCDHHVFCPLHDWKINLDDGNVQAPDEGHVRTAEVVCEEETGRVYLRTEGAALKLSS